MSTALTDFKEALKALQIPVARVAFEDPVNLPFAIFALSYDDDFCADDKHYFRIHDGWFELYSEYTDARYEALKCAITGIFENGGIPYRKSTEDYIPLERMYYIRWDIQLF